jgi:hypothetical protein
LLSHETPASGALAEATRDASRRLPWTEAVA